MIYNTNKLLIFSEIYSQIKLIVLNSLSNKIIPVLLFYLLKLEIVTCIVIFIAGVTDVLPRKNNLVSLFILYESVLRSGNHAMVNEKVLIQIWKETFYVDKITACQRNYSNKKILYPLNSKWTMCVSSEMSISTVAIGLVWNPSS
jgi:hypothetical protein